MRLSDFLAGVLAILVLPGIATASPDVQILTYGIHFGGQVVYRYQVSNNSASSIHHVELGLDSPGKELPATPWINSLAVTDQTVPAPADMCVPFTGMGCQVALFQFDYMTEPRSVVVMESVETNPAYAASALVRPGTTSSFAEIHVPARTPGYLTAAGSVYFIDSNTRDASGKPLLGLEVPFRNVDTMPPTITGTASTVKDGGMLAVSVQLQIADNLDPSPEVALVSVTANEALKPNDVQGQIGADTRALRLKRSKGRVYSLTYRAIDGSENSATTTIQVPGDV